LSLLLDSHALIWWLSGDQRLSERARGALSDEDRDVYISAASAWEITTKRRLGKLPDAGDIALAFEEILAEQDFKPLSISVRHAQMAGNMEGAHKDPFDRMLIAQALVEDLVLVSNERAFDAFGISRLW
jgi:PIN domain nuclease of toxin-antitoxin system